MENYTPLISILVAAIAAEAAWLLAAIVTKPGTSRDRVVKVMRRASVSLVIAVMTVLGTVYISDGLTVSGSLLLIAAAVKVALGLLTSRVDKRAQLAQVAR